MERAHVDAAKRGASYTAELALARDAWRRIGSLVPLGRLRDAYSKAASRSALRVTGRAKESPESSGGEGSGWGKGRSSRSNGDGGDSRSPSPGLGGLVLIESESESGASSGSDTGVDDDSDGGDDEAAISLQRREKKKKKKEEEEESGSGHDDSTRGTGNASIGGISGAHVPRPAVSAALSAALSALGGTNGGRHPYRELWVKQAGALPLHVPLVPDLSVDFALLSWRASVLRQVAAWDVAYPSGADASHAGAGGQGPTVGSSVGARVRMLQAMVPGMLSTGVGGGGRSRGGSGGAGVGHGYDGAGLGGGIDSSGSLRRLGSSRSIGHSSRAGSLMGKDALFPGTPIAGHGGLTAEDLSSDRGEGRAIAVLAGSFLGPNKSDEAGSESASGVVGPAPLELHRMMAQAEMVASSRTASHASVHAPSSAWLAWAIAACSHAMWCSADDR